MGDPGFIQDSCRGSEGLAAAEPCIFECMLLALPATVSLMRRQLDRVLRQQGVASERRSDIALVLTEAATNVVVHAYVGRRPGPLYASAQMPGQTLIVSVVDCGCGAGSPSRRPGAGLGLELMGKLADELLVSANEPEPGTSVRASFERIGPRRAVRPSAHEPDDRAQMFREYLRVLCASHESLREDTEAVLAQARQTLAYARRCERDRRGVDGRIPGGAPPRR